MRRRMRAASRAAGLAALVLGLSGPVVGRAAEAVSRDSFEGTPGAPDGPKGPEAPDGPQIRAVVVLVVLLDPRPGAAGFAAALVDEVEAALREVYQVEVRRVAPRRLPTGAYRAARKRYRADDLLTYLAAQIPAGLPADTRVLGLTTADISTTKGKVADWGVFGLGQLGGAAAVVSSHRLRRKARDAAQVRWRVRTTAVHEVGHVLGLDHCGEPGCVMLDAEGGIANTDESSGEPGPQCARELDSAAPLRSAAARPNASIGR